MYFQHLNKLVLEIPDSGHSAMLAALVTEPRCAKGPYSVKEFLWDKQYSSLNEHQRRGLVKIGKLQAVAIIDNPVTRLTRQVLVYCHHQDASVHEALRAAWTRSSSMFKPQYQFLDVPDGWEAKTGMSIDIRVWDSARIDEALYFVNGNPYNLPATIKPPLVGKTSDEIMKHHLYDELLDSANHYGPDIHLWVRAQRTSPLGEGLE